MYFGRVYFYFYFIYLFFFFIFRLDVFVLFAHFMWVLSLVRVTDWPPSEEYMFSAANDMFSCLSTCIVPLRISGFDFGSGCKSYWSLLTFIFLSFHIYECRALCLAQRDTCYQCIKQQAYEPTTRAPTVL